ncbi:acyl-coenzyme A diphosphatase FITM2-like [Tubulanus polymorphus]|uniref:acyl-coenzyme A diphosphatase FITM2-like n=1 Tax=Tubulanus polymorphus TaxID=672921 RepID=UPI003DA53A03
MSGPVRKFSLRKSTNLRENQRENATGNEEKKKRIVGGAEPWNIYSFITMFIFYLCKKSLFMETSVKLGIYLILVCCGSVVFDVFRFPKTYFSDKNNALNQYFVKLSWGWTSILVAIFIYLTSFVYCCGNVYKITRHLSRLLVGTASWYFWTQIVFHKVEQATGMCSNTQITNKILCVKSKFNWFGFDLSGHTFLLIHCLLIISEEVKPLKKWDKIRNFIFEEEKEMKNLNESELIVLKDSFNQFTIYIRILFIILTLLLLLWELMLIATVVYFHNMPQKLIAALIAVCNWFITYHIWFYCDLSPGRPGDLGIRYQHIK